MLGSAGVVQLVTRPAGEGCHHLSQPSSTHSLACATLFSQVKVVWEATGNRVAAVSPLPSASSAEYTRRAALTPPPDTRRQCLGDWLDAAEASRTLSIAAGGTSSAHSTPPQAAQPPFPRRKLEDLMSADELAAANNM
jgi:hypothetical protein